MHCSSMVSCQKGPTRHAYAWQIGPFWQDTLVIYRYVWSVSIPLMFPWLTLDVYKWSRWNNGSIGRIRSRLWCVVITIYLLCSGLISAILTSIGYSIYFWNMITLSLSCNRTIEWYSLHTIMVIWRCRKPFTQLPFELTQLPFESNVIISKGYCVGRVQTQLYDPVIYFGFLSSTMCLLSKWPLLLSGQCCDHNNHWHHHDFAKGFMMLWQKRFPSLTLSKYSTSHTVKSSIDVFLDVLLSKLLNKQSSWQMI